ncbi:MAG: glycosyltransferase family 4 protein [Candidatus Kariarchaeaceae archaeon]|jgi:glycosyltransferase involved in cell wall biosynthesis
MTKLVFLIGGHIDYKSGGSIYNKNIITSLSSRFKDFRYIEIFVENFLEPSVAEREKFSIIISSIEGHIILDGLLINFLDNIRFEVLSRIIMVYHLPLYREFDPHQAKYSQQYKLDARVLPSLKHIVVTGRSLLEVVIGKGMIEDKVTLIEPGIEKDQSITIQPTKNLKVEAVEKINFLMLGSVTPRKNQFQVVKTITKYKFPYKLNIIGNSNLNSDYSKNLLEFIKNQHLTQNIVVHGILSDTSKYNIIKDSDVLINASKFETFGMAVAEAMCMRLGIISKSTGNMTETVGDGGEYFSNNQELLELMNKLQNSEFLENLQNRAYTKCKEFSSVEKQQSKFIKLIEKLILSDSFHFDKTWLQTRYQYDVKARNIDVLTSVIEFTSQFETINIVDLGAGLGSNTKFLSSQFPRIQNWLLLEFDKEIISAGVKDLIEYFEKRNYVVRSSKYEVSAIKGKKIIKIKFKQADFTDIDILAELVETKPDIITANAFFDLFSKKYVDQFLNTFQNIPMYLSLNYTSMQINDDQESNRWIKLYHAHMKREQEKGVALAFDFPSYLNTRKFKTMYSGTSSWILKQGETLLQSFLLDFM